MIRIDRELLRQQAQLHGVPLDEQMLDCFEVTADMMVRWNERINLTAITEPRDIVLKHFVDSLAIVKLLPQKSFSLIDVGTGAGYPGIPLAIVLGNMRLTLLDSQDKRLVYIKELCRELKIEADIVHMRAEQAGHEKDMRQAFDVAVARAVANLPVLCELCLPLVCVGGKFIAMKGSEGHSEAVSAQNAAELLGAKQASTKTYYLNDDTQIKRTLILYDKITITPPEYPRIYSKIKKHPL